MYNIFLETLVLKFLFSEPHETKLDFKDVCLHESVFFLPFYLNKCLVFVLKPPPADKWNGDLTAFSIGYKRVSHGSTQSLPFTYNILPLATTLNPMDAMEYRVRGLQESSSYTVVVQAVNRAGFGPSSEPVLVKTSYGGELVFLLSTQCVTPWTQITFCFAWNRFFTEL